MSKAKKRLDNNQLSIFDYDAQINEYVALKTEILKKNETPAPPQAHSWEEACVEIAAACKSAIKKSGLSRELVVDAVNLYFGWSTPRTITDTHGRTQHKGLSIHMFNHYLSKPSEYPLPAYLIFAIQNVTGSLAPCKVFAEAENAKVASGDEVRQMTLGKIDDNILELQRLKKEFRGTLR